MTARSYFFFLGPTGRSANGGYVKDNSEIVAMYNTCRFRFRLWTSTEACNFFLVDKLQNCSSLNPFAHGNESQYQDCWPKVRKREMDR